MGLEGQEQILENEETPLEEGQDFSDQEDQEEEVSEANSDEIVDEENESGEEETPTLADVVSMVKDIGTAVHTLSSRQGRMSKSLLGQDRQPTGFFQSGQRPQPKSVRPYTQEQNQGQYFNQDQNSGIPQNLTDSLAEGDTKPLVSFIQQSIQRGVQEAIGQYTPVLNQMTQLVSASEQANNNMAQLKTAFGDINRSDVAKLMRDDGVKLEEVEAFEKNPGLFPLEAVAPYYQTVFRNKQSTGDKTAQILQNSTKKSKTVMVKQVGKGQKARSVLSPIKGKSKVELSEMMQKNLALRKQIMEEYGLLDD